MIQYQGWPPIRGCSPSPAWAGKPGSRLTGLAPGTRDTWRLSDRQTDRQEGRLSCDEWQLVASAPSRDPSKTPGSTPNSHISGAAQEGEGRASEFLLLVVLLVSQATARVSPSFFSSSSGRGRAVPGCRTVLGRVGCFSHCLWLLVCDRPFQKLPANSHPPESQTHRTRPLEAAQRSVGPNSPS